MYFRAGCNSQENQIDAFKDKNCINDNCILLAKNRRGYLQWEMYSPKQNLYPNIKIKDMESFPNISDIVGKISSLFLQSIQRMKNKGVIYEQHPFKRETLKCKQCRSVLGILDREQKKIHVIKRPAGTS